MFRFMHTFLSFFHVTFFALFPVLVFAETGDRDFWIDRYLSVSYPLKSIKINSRYGIRKDPFTGKKANHSGIDLQASYEEVYAMFDGVVETIGEDARSGRYVIIRHGTYTVSYCHLLKVTAKEGERLIAGDIVAVSGNSGRSTGPHLHITCKRDNVVTDPYTLLIYIRDVRAEAMLALGGQAESVNWSRSCSRADCEAFIQRYADVAMEQQKLYGIPSSVTLAQMALESGWGQSTLARHGNNFFGVKCSKQWLAAGKPYSLHNDDKPNEKFCNYASVYESVEHHSQVLMGDRYKRCRMYPETDYHNWLVHIKKAGYATSKDYVRKCEDVINQYHLQVYDQLALSA